MKTPEETKREKRIKQLERMIPKMKESRKISSAFIEAREWELKALQLERKIDEKRKAVAMEKHFAQRKLNAYHKQLDVDKAIIRQEGIIQGLSWALNQLK